MHQINLRVYAHVYVVLPKNVSQLLNLVAHFFADI